jgi:hypothetical protein
MGLDLNYLVGFNLVDDTDALDLERNLRKNRNSTFYIKGVKVFNTTTSSLFDLSLSEFKDFENICEIGIRNTLDSSDVKSGRLETTLSGRILKQGKEVEKYGDNIMPLFYKDKVVELFGRGSHCLTLNMLLAFETAVYLDLDNENCFVNFKGQELFDRDATIFSEFTNSIRLDITSYSKYIRDNYGVNSNSIVLLGNLLTEGDYGYYRDGYYSLDFSKLDSDTILPLGFKCIYLKIDVYATPRDFTKSIVVPPDLDELKIDNISHLSTAGTNRYLTLYISYKNKLKIIRSLWIHYYFGYCDYNENDITDEALDYFIKHLKKYNVEIEFY